MWMGDTQLAGSASKSQGGFGGAVMPGNFGGEKPEGMEKPEGGFNGEPPADMERPEGGRGGFGGRGGATSAEASIEFVMEDGGNYFNNVTVME